SPRAGFPPRPRRTGTRGGSDDGDSLLRVRRDLVSVDSVSPAAGVDRELRDWALISSLVGAVIAVAAAHRAADSSSPAYAREGAPIALAGGLALLLLGGTVALLRGRLGGPFEDASRRPT